MSTERNDNDSNRNLIKTVAYIPPGTSLGAATFLALACSEIVMADTAALADFSYLKNLSEGELKTRRDMLVPLARKQGYSPKLFEATLDPKMVLYWASPKKGIDQLLTPAELEEDQRERRNGPRARKWPTAPSYFKIDSILARMSGTAQVLNQASLENLYALYNLGSTKIHVASDDWMDRVREFFQHPLVRFFLVMLGIIGLILELKMPGTMVPGVLAAICFVLFFWSYSFDGRFTMLAVLLFVLGVILVVLEIFVVPGFGFTGIAGIVLMVCGLALATLEKWPSNSQDWFDVGVTIGTFGMSLGAAVIAAMIVAWFLPSIPYANRLVLNPPVDEPESPNQAPRGTAGSHRHCLDLPASRRQGPVRR